MNNKIIALMIPLFFFACEAEDDVEEKTIVGSWNYTISSGVGGSCDGTDDDVDGSGTAVFTDTEVTLNDIESLAQWCDEDLVNDTLCVEYGDSISLSYFQEMCIDDGGTVDASTGGCINSWVNTYTISDSLYLTQQETVVGLEDIMEEDCVEEGGLWTVDESISTEYNGICTFTYTSGWELTLDASTASLTQTYTEDDTLYCVKISLTK